MKKLGFKSKNILTVLLVILFAVIVDVAVGQVFLSLGAVSIAAIPFVNLEKDTGTCNMAGIATTAYVIALDDIAAFPTVTDPATTPAELVTYIGDFTLKSGKRWTTMYSTKEMGELLSEGDGPTDGKFFRNKATLFHPRTTPEALGMMTLFKDTDVVVILTAFGGGGQMRVIGDSYIPATIAGSENSGKAFGDEKGITYAIEAASCKPAMVYDGEILTTDAPYSYTEVDETNTPSQYVAGYEGITGWDKVANPTLYMEVWDNAGTLTLRAYETDGNRTLQTNEVFTVVEGGNTVVEASLSGYGGTLTFTAGAADGDEYKVTAG